MSKRETGVVSAYFYKIELRLKASSECNIDYERFNTILTQSGYSEPEFVDNYDRSGLKLCEWLIYEENLNKKFAEYQKKSGVTYNVFINLWKESGKTREQFIENLEQSSNPKQVITNIQSSDEFKQYLIYAGIGAIIIAIIYIKK